MNHWFGSRGRILRIAIGALSAASLLAAGFGTSAAQAAGSGGARSAASLPAGHPRGVIPRIGVDGKPTAAASRYRANAANAAKSANAVNAGNAANPACSPCRPPLLFTIGRPVMGGQTVGAGHVTITPFFWAPAGYSFDPLYRSIINGYLANVAAASGRYDNVFSVSTQYYQQQTSSSPLEYIQYAITKGAEIDDASPFPGGCTPAAGYSTCVADGPLQTELASHVAQQDDSHLYMVFFPAGVETCQGPGSAATGQACSSNVYCAYHSGFNNGPNPVIYANQPYPGLSGCSDPWDGGNQSPNGNVYADIQLSMVSHEANEAITDSYGAWTDSAGYENGDECAYVYGVAAGSPGSYYNQVINGGHYFTQLEFSNLDYAAGRGSQAGNGNATNVTGCEAGMGLGAPTGVHGSASVTSVDLAWTAPASNGGSAITNYRVSVLVNGTAIQQLLTGSTTPTFTVTRLNTWQGYTFTVAAINANGTGPESAPTGVLTPFVPLQPPAFASAGGILSSGPAVAAMSASRVDVFVRGADNALWHNWSIDSGAHFQPQWSSLGGILISDPAAISITPGRIDIFVKGADYGLWQQTTTDGGGHWLPQWVTEGGILYSGPEVASGGPNNMDVLVQGADTALWENTWNGTAWLPQWVSVGGKLLGDPMAVSALPNTLDVFVKGLDGALWQRSYFNNTWTGHDWHSLGGHLASSPDAASCGNGHIDLMVVGSDATLWHLGFNGTRWSFWQPLTNPGAVTPPGGVFGSDTGSVCRPGTQFIDIMGEGSDRALWQATINGF